MPDTLKITLAQLNQSVGDLAGNAAAMLAARERAKDSDLIVFPELQLIGYPPEDLILKPASFPRLVSLLPNAQGCPIPDSGHNPHRGRPDLVNPRVLEFIQTHSAQPGLDASLSAIQFTPRKGSDDS